MYLDSGEKHSRLIERSNAIGIDFLRTDLVTALTFIQVAETSNSPETSTRNFRKALEAYRAVLHFLPRLLPSTAEFEEIRSKLEQVRLHLVQAGYSCK